MYDDPKKRAAFEAYSAHWDQCPQCEMSPDSCTELHRLIDVCRSLDGPVRVENFGDYSIVFL